MATFDHHHRRKYIKYLQRYVRSRSVYWWLLRIIILFTVGYFAVTTVSSMRSKLPRDFSAWLAKIKHTPALQTMRLFLGGYGSYKKAKAYYDSQHPLLENSMHNMTLHPYWARSQKGLTGGETWQDMVVGRVSSMSEQLRQQSRDDFKVEKDKCEMYGFFERNNIPFVPLVGMWDTKEGLVEYLEKMRDSKEHQEKYVFPLWLKSCHLTQGDDAGRIRITKKDLADEKKFREVVGWIRLKWAQKPNDDARAWSDDAKIILHSLKPRFLIQQSFKGPYGDSVGFPKSAPVELKVEVIWGRAYLANICDYEAYALRDGTIERWDTSIFSKVAHVPLTSDEDNKNVLWLKKEGHLEKVYKLAEQVCKAMHADQVRVDIFVRPGDNSAVMVNEISISPGALYKWHAQFMATAWRTGHTTHAYTLLKSEKKVYEEGMHKGKLGNGEDWFVPQQ